MGLFGPPDIAKLEEKGNVKKLLSLLDNEDYGIQHKARCALLRIGEPIIPACISLMESDPFGFHIFDMETILPRIGPPAIEPLDKLLDRSGAGVRKNAIRVLKQFRDPAVIQPLLKGFADADDLTAEWALKGLQRNSSPEIVEPLLEHSQSLQH